jgi:hypothetical protein
MKIWEVTGFWTDTLEPFNGLMTDASIGDLSDKQDEEIMFYDVDEVDLKDNTLADMHILSFRALSQSPDNKIQLNYN